MKLFAKLSALGVALVMTASFASADTIQLGSYGTGASNMGNQNSALGLQGGLEHDLRHRDGGIWASPAAEFELGFPKPCQLPSERQLYRAERNVYVLDDIHAGQR